jgi:hypothetical protein
MLSSLGRATNKPPFLTRVQNASGTVDEIRGDGCIALLT